MIPKTSSRIEHFLAIADLYIQLHEPETFVVEPQINKHYQPDIYLIYNNEPVIVEVQRTRTSLKRMQEKVDEFQKSYYRGDHQARTLWIQGHVEYPIKIDSKFVLVNGLDLLSHQLQQVKLVMPVRP